MMWPSQKPGVANDKPWYGLLQRLMCLTTNPYMAYLKAWCGLLQGRVWLTTNPDMAYISDESDLWPIYWKVHRAEIAIHIYTEIIV